MKSCGFAGLLEKSAFCGRDFCSGCALLALKKHNPAAGRILFPSDLALAGSAVF